MLCWPCQTIRFFTSSELTTRLDSSTLLLILTTLPPFHSYMYSSSLSTYSKLHVASMSDQPYPESNVSSWEFDVDFTSERGDAWDNNQNMSSQLGGTDNDGTPNNVRTSIDPGYWMFIFVAMYSVVLVICLPVSIVLGKRWERKKNVEPTQVMEVAELENKSGHSGSDGTCRATGFVDDDLTSDSTDCPSPRRRTSPESSSSTAQLECSGSPRIVVNDRSAGDPNAAVICSQTNFCNNSHNAPVENPSGTVDPDQLQDFATSHVAEDNMRNQTIGDAALNAPFPSAVTDTSDRYKPNFRTEDVEIETTICFGPRALWKPKTIAKGFSQLVSLAKPDKEARRILRLALPFTLSAVGEAFFDAATIAILSHFLGTDAVTSYALVNLFIGLTDVLIRGFIRAERTICAHAYGAGNNFLAGQYVQLALLFYITISTPFLFMWAYIMGDTLRALGFNEDVQTTGTEYTRAIIFSYLLGGMASGFGSMLDITGHEYFGFLLDFSHNAVYLGAIVCLVVFVPDARLVHVAIIEVILQAVFLVGMSACIIIKGWYSNLWDGMLASLAIRNRQAAKNLIFTAIPLSIGSFLEYGEWELLTFFTTYLGSAEVATWALLGSIWELLEASTEGLAEAASIRVAYHLGKGHPETAELSSYKSMLLSFAMSLFVTIIFFICGDYLPTWFSSDETIQLMLSDLIPLVGFGNITMAVGLVSWGLVGSQGRYRLATLVSVFCSWFVTIPLSATFVLALNINLKGLVGAVIAGNTTTGFIFMHIILRSNWKRLSEKIQELNAVTGEIDSSDGEDDYSSESSKESSISDDDSSLEESVNPSSDDFVEEDDSDLERGDGMDDDADHPNAWSWWWSWHRPGH